MPRSLLRAVKRLAWELCAPAGCHEQQPGSSSEWPSPNGTAILVLGGDRRREEFAARESIRYGRLQVFVSSGSYRFVSDFDPDALDNPHRHRMAGVDFADLQARLVLDRGLLPPPVV
jgi:hypothetical protein